MYTQKNGLGGTHKTVLVKRGAEKKAIETQE